MGLVQVLHFLPVVVVRLLDAWSYQVALRKQRARQQRCLQATAAAADPAVDAPVPYRLKPWRD